MKSRGTYNRLLALEDQVCQHLLCDHGVCHRLTNDVEWCLEHHGDREVSSRLLHTAGGCIGRAYLEGLEELLVESAGNIRLLSKELSTSEAQLKVSCKKCIGEFLQSSAARD
jgi:hypothetical protein